MINCYIMVGLPGSGKSTFTKHADFGADVVSTDAYFEELAKDKNTTYADAFHNIGNMKHAESEMWLNAIVALAADRGVIVDRTHMTVKSRARSINKLREIASTLNKEIRINCIIMSTSLDEAKYRNSKRPNGRVIPESVIDNMHASFIPPSYTEGFDVIMEV